MKASFEKPLVSVIIPTFNRSWCIGNALTSVLEQTYQPLEILVVDDGSTDDTRDVLIPFMERITFIRQENQGVSAARNHGIRKSSGQLIAFLDSDDLWLPGKVACQASYFIEHSDLMICQTEEIWIRNSKRVNPKRKHKKPSGRIFEPSLHLCLVSPSAVMMRRDLFHHVGYFDEALPACEDYDLWLRVSLNHEIHLIDEPMIIKHGGHEDQLSRQHSLDKYRIRSIAKLLKEGTLSPCQRNSAQEVFRQKCRIYGQGCLKRGKMDEGSRYLDLASGVFPF